MDECAPRPCRVTRNPGAVPRRAGRAWPLGTTEAVLALDQRAALESTPGYAVEVQAPTPGEEVPILMPIRPTKRLRRT